MMLGVTFCPKEVTQLGHSGEYLVGDVLVRIGRFHQLDVSRVGGLLFS